ncbi:MAG: cache domain-containing protein [Desulfohalobiaceae bacterium]|nr:cache domain-containing protein [Desulfohalobiaceae bacterium]
MTKLLNQTELDSCPIVLKQQRVFSLFLLVLSGLLLGLFTPAEASKGVYDWAYVRLDYAREEKAGQLRNFWERTHALARQAAQDPSVVSCFAINRRYAEMRRKGGVPQAVTDKVKAFRENFNTYYIKEYFSFYDLLFVNRQGKVFYTIRKESDLNTNLFQEDESSGSPLGQCLRDKPRQEVFVDFHEYGPSAKPAAFFVEPLHKEGQFLGWLVLQCAVNKVNTLFAWEDDLGQTGETFLVNREGFMLTESNFVGDSTILDKHLDDRNIQAKFADEKGHRVVTDYRGRTALSSFEVVHFLGTSWLAVAKMDKDEIITRHYTRHRRYYADKLLEHLRKARPAPLQDLRESPAAGLRVDMDEYRKAGDGERLQTIGISTCTGLLLTYPERFAYLAHISPRDKVYGGDQTNLLGQMLKQVKSFDIRPCEKRGIVCVAVAPHLQSLLTIIDKLIQEGFLLSQIRVLYHPGAQSAAMQYDYLEEDLEVVWRLSDEPGNRGFQCMKCAFDPGDIIQDVIQEEEGSGGAMEEG